MTSFSREQPSPRLLRIHSATGVVPVGTFLLLHLWLNLRATQGQEAYSAMVRRLQASWALGVVEIVGIHAPLLFHAGYGVAIMLSGPSGEPPRPAAKSWTRPMARMSGVATLAFVAFHLWQFRIRVALGRLQPDDFFSTLTDALSATNQLGIPVVAAVYLAGLAAASYHFANGLPSFAHRFGLVTTERATRLVAVGSTLLGLVAFLSGANTVIYFATGATWPVARSTGLTEKIPLEPGRDALRDTRIGTEPLPPTPPADSR